MDLKADEIMRKKEDFEDDALPLQPPTPGMLQRMTERVDAIREINVRNEAARGIVAAVVAAAGQLPKAKTG
jgi:hypothetical protein